MSLSNAQKSLLKRAQREAEIGDVEYREHLMTVAGVESSTDARIGDRHFDKLLGLFEAIHWRQVDAGVLQRKIKGNAVFQKRGYWAEKNTAAETSRDRFVRPSIGEEIVALEEQVARLGYHPSYCAEILARVTSGRYDTRALYSYRAALQRTLGHA